MRFIISRACTSNDRRWFEYLCERDFVDELRGQGALPAFFEKGTPEFGVPCVSIHDVH
ncbi:MAG: hypothetical protein ACI87E_003054 [Mariniblastus sp.]|jgi:hypothetical protein